MKSIILPPLGTLYGAITRARASLYERGTFRSSLLPLPVISVGNITAGGTGKTPLVEWVARTLAGADKKVCILTRGYGRDNPNEHILVSDFKKVLSNPNAAGDEPYLLASNLLGIAAVVSDANRLRGGQGAIKHLGAECFVLDDGFQHLQLKRDLNIVTIDATNPFGGAKMLPVGLLREPLSGLKRADCFVLTRCDQIDEVNSVHSELAKLSGDRPIFHSRMATRGVKPIHNSATSNPSQPIAAFCAVGNPTSFFNQLRASGYEVSLQKSFPDHHRYTQQEVDALNESAKQSGALSLITTAKDAVKLQTLSTSLPTYSLEIEIEIENSAELRRLIIEALNR